MRLTDFKTKLFIFFAGKLLKWAASIEREIGSEQPPPPAAVDDSKTNPFAECARGSTALSGPPEHWTRLVTKGPPQHWIDLVKEQAPQLLVPDGGEPVMQQPNVDDSASDFLGTELTAECDYSVGIEEEASHNVAPPKSRRGTSRRVEPRYPPRKVNRSSWLNRLRFFEPVRHGEPSEPVYESDQAITEFESAARNATVEGPATFSQQPPPTHLPDRVRYLTATEQDFIGSPARFRHPEHQHGEALREQQHAGAESAAFEQREPVLEGRPSISHRYPNHPLANSRYVNRSERLSRTDVHSASHESRARNLDVRFTETRKVISPAVFGSDPGRDHFSAEIHPRSREVATAKAVTGHRTPKIQSQLTGGTRGRELTLPPALQKELANPPRVRDDVVRSLPLSSPLSSFNPTTPPAPTQSLLFNQRDARDVNAHGQAHDEFALVESGRPSPLKSRTEAGENVWPRLPPMAKFEIADELAAREQEAEARRRLDQEQRGTLWNA